MKILVTGGNGQLGTALSEVLKDEEILLTDTGNMDITDPVQIEKVFSEFKPEFLVHGAAYTNVDGCEQDPELARKVNAEGTDNLAQACLKHKVKMIYISTDYVFDGKGQKPYLPDDQTGPISVYGETKLAGEVATAKVPSHWVLRTSWVYGEGKNFVRTMLELAKTHKELTVVDDQVGRPTWAHDLALAIYDVIKKQPEPGTYHVTGDGPIISWADFAKKIFELAGLDVAVKGITTEEYLAGKEGQKIAPRPAYSALDLAQTKALGFPVPEWRRSLRMYLTQQYD